MSSVQSLAARYGLDTELDHIIEYMGRPYITRDGLLHVAHRSEQLDGIVLEDQGETDTHYTATVSVWRKDMSHPFRFPGRYPKQGGNRKYAVEMAVKCAEVATLRRAFDVAIATVEERWDSTEPEAVVLDRHTLGELHDRVRALPEGQADRARDFIRSTGATATVVTVRQYERIDDWLTKVEAAAGEALVALEAGEGVSSQHSGDTPEPTLLGDT
jgi:hypothetical protein